MTDNPAPAQPLTPGQFVEKEARRLSGPSRAHRGAIPARFWRDAIDAQAHDHDPSSCGECREDFLLRFVPAPLSPEWNAEMQTAWAEGFEAGSESATLDAARARPEAPSPDQVVEWLREALNLSDEWASIARSLVIVQTRRLAQEARTNG